MFNLTVAEAHTFFVGNSGWLAHNSEVPSVCGLTEVGLQHYAGHAEKIPVNGTAENIRGITRENESAIIVANNGLKVYQKPPRDLLDRLGISPKTPDLLIEDKIFDVYSPKRPSARNIASEMTGKVTEEQTERILLNLEDSPVTLDEMIAQVSNYKIEGLKELIIIKNGVLNKVVLP